MIAPPMILQIEGTYRCMVTCRFLQLLLSRTQGSPSPRSTASEGFARSTTTNTTIKSTTENSKQDEGLPEEIVVVSIGYYYHKGCSVFCCLFFWSTFVTDH
jgi:hypothetical protein